MNLDQLKTWAIAQNVTGFKAFKDGAYIFTKPAATSGTAFMAVINIGVDAYAFLEAHFTITHQEIVTEDITGFLQPVKE